MICEFINDILYSIMDDRSALRELLNLTRDLTQGMRLQKALQRVTDSTLKLLPASHASIRIFDENQGELLSAARSGIGINHAPVSFKKGEGVAGWVVDNGKVARINKVNQDQRYKKISSQGFSIGSILAVPLWSGGEILGVLAAISDEENAYSEKDEELAVLLANCTVPPLDKARLEHLAVTDHLTLAFNYRYLMPRLSEEIARARRLRSPLSLLLIDLDRFKMINDRYGHAIGDRVLKAFAQLMRDSVRCYDIQVRRGGDEFVLIMPQTETKLASVVAQRLCNRVAREKIDIGDEQFVRVTASIGLVTWNGTENGMDFEGRADDAMYRAKQQGGSQVAKGR